LALRGNAAFSTLSAVVFLVAADAIAGFLKILPAQQVMVVGVQLALFAVWLWWLSRRPVVPRWQVWLIIALDVLWVGGSFQIVLASPPTLTVGGKWAIGMVADVVALFAVLQFLGLRRLQRARLATSS
jgi:hypothetical protein